jgi:hypothetical protein
LGYAGVGCAAFSDQIIHGLQDTQGFIILFNKKKTIKLHPNFSNMNVTRSDSPSRVSVSKE